MSRLFVVVEGQTEEMFVNKVLCPYLADFGVGASAIVPITNAGRGRGGRVARGGGRWKHWLSAIRRKLGSAESGVFVTTMFDLYGLPDDFPERERGLSVRDSLAYVRLLEQAMSRVIGSNRFVGYIQLHEFEALVLACLEFLPSIIDDPALRRNVETLRGEVGAMKPEDVNSGCFTAPSKRLMRSLGQAYNKCAHGVLVTSMAGIPALKRKCPHFGWWVEVLERLVDRRE